MSRPRGYHKELRERALRMVVEVRADYESEYAAITGHQQELADMLAAD